MLDNALHLSVTELDRKTHCFKEGETYVIIDEKAQ